MNLSLNIVEAEILGNTKIPDETWIIVNADRSNHPSSTYSFNINKSKSIDYIIKLVIREEKVQNLYVYFTMCKYGSSSDDIIPIARTKSQICNLPLDGCSQFKLPLYSVEKPSEEFITLTMIGTLIPTEKDNLLESRLTGSNEYIL